MNVSDVTQLIVASVTLINFIMIIASTYKISRVEHNTNHLTEQLVNEVRLASIAKGLLEGHRKYARRVSKTKKEDGHR